MFTIPALVEGATIYVAKGGSDSNSCSSARSSNIPKASINGGIACMSGGDTLIIGDGTYDEQITAEIPSGSSGAPTVIQAANRNGVVVRPSGRYWGIAVFSIDGRSYITIDGIDADAQNVEQPYYVENDSRHITIKNGTARNGQGYYGSGIELRNSSENTVINMDVCDNGVGVLAHGIYASGSNNLIQGNRVYRNSGFGLHVYPYSATYNIIRGNEVHDNGFGSAYIVPGNTFQDNAMYSNGGVEIVGD